MVMERNDGASELDRAGKDATESTDIGRQVAAILGGRQSICGAQGRDEYSKQKRLTSFPASVF
jgi:hypothetical protein